MEDELQIIGLGMCTLDVLIRCKDLPTWEHGTRIGAFGFDGGGPVGTAMVAAASASSPRPALRTRWRAETGSRSFAPKQAQATTRPERDVHLLEEKQRPGEYMPIEEDEHGTYIMNSRDLRAVEHVHRLAEIGVDCLKIEGRTKSHYYTARTTQVYRRAIDDAVRNALTKLAHLHLAPTDAARERIARAHADFPILGRHADACFPLLLVALRRAVAEHDPQPVLAQMCDEPRHARGGARIAGGETGDAAHAARPAIRCATSVVMFA